MEPKTPVPSNPPSDGDSRPNGHRPPRRAERKYTRKTLKEYRGKYGRPTLLTPELRDKICNFVRIGSYIETAVAAAGLSKETFYAWLKDSAHLHTLKRNALETGQPFEPSDDELKLMEFSDALERAMAESELQDVATIKQAAAAGQWQAAAWRLERKFPKKWGRRYIVEDSTPAPTNDQTQQSGQRTIDLKKLPTDHLKTLETILTAAVVEEETNEPKGQP